MTTTAAAAAATYWTASVYVDDRCVVSSADDSLSIAISGAISSCVYYQAMYPDNQISIRGIKQYCATCHSLGTIAHSTRSWRKVRCPTCKGKPPTGQLDNIPFHMPDPANNVHLVTSTHAFSS